MLCKCKCGKSFSHIFKVFYSLMSIYHLMFKTNIYLRLAKKHVTMSQGLSLQVWRLKLHFQSLCKDVKKGIRKLHHKYLIYLNLQKHPRLSCASSFLHSLSCWLHCQLIMSFFSQWCSTTWPSLYSSLILTDLVVLTNVTNYRPVIVPTIECEDISERSCVKLPNAEETTLDVTACVPVVDKPKCDKVSW